MKIRVGMLEVVERLPSSKFLCLCDCGNHRVVAVGHFNTRKIKSCGCHRKLHKHCNNKIKSKEYISWANMISRCKNPSNKRYKDYGGKGIKVCESWLDFRNFYADMGDCPEGFQIDRIDNNGNYEKENCRWISRKENMANRSISKRYFIDGVMYKSLIEAANDFKVSTSTIKAWCEGRKVKDFLARKKEVVVRFYPPLPNCWVEKVY